MSNEREPLLQRMVPEPTVLDDIEQAVTGTVGGSGKLNRRNKKFIGIAGIVMILGVLITISLWCGIRLYRNMEGVVEQSVDVKVEGVHIEKLNTEDGSIDLLMDVESHIDYNNADILDSVTAKYLIWNSYFVHDLKLDLQDINISLESKDEKLDSLGEVKMTPFRVKVAQGSTDKVQIRLNVKPDSLAVLNALKDLIINRKSVILKGDFLLKIKLGALRIPIKSMKLNFRNLLVDPTDLINELYDHNVSMESFAFSKNTISASLMVRSDNEAPTLSRYINYIPKIPNFFYTDLYFESCEEGDFEKLLDFEVSGISSFSHRTNKNAIKLAAPNNINELFFKDCPSGQMSPLSRLIQSVVYKEPTSSFIFKSSQKNNKIFPMWFMELLNKISIPYNVPALSGFFPESKDEPSKSVIQNVSIADLDFNIDNGIDRPQLASGEIKFDIFSPITLDGMKVEGLLGVVDLSYENLKFGFMNISSWLPCTSKILHTECKLQNNDIIITSTDVYGLLIADYLIGVDVSVGVDFVADALINWPLVFAESFKISSLKGSGTGSL